MRIINQPLFYNQIFFIMKNLIFFFALLIGSMSFAPTQASAAASFGITPAATTAAPVKKTAPKTTLLQKIKKAMAEMETILLVILAIFVPPLAVYLKENAAGTNFWITLVLWVLGGALFGILGFLGSLGVLAAIIYALYIVLRN